jgi:hypothetical protein
MTTAANEIDAAEQMGHATTTGTISPSALFDNSAPASTAAVSRSSSPPLSPLLDLPAELRVMVYEHCFTTEYKRLPFGDYAIIRVGKYEIAPVYWQSFTISVALMATNRQLNQEIQALPPKMRTYDAPDIIWQYPAPWVLPNIFYTS